METGVSFGFGSNSTCSEIGSAGSSSAGMYRVSKKIPPEVFGHFYQTVETFSPNFTRLLYVPVYATLQLFIHAVFSNYDEVMP